MLVFVSHYDIGMKRYLEPSQIKSRFFLLYFLYGKVKYGSKGSDAERLGRMSAYKAMMHLYRPMVLINKRVLISEAEARTVALCQKARRELPDGDLLQSFLLTVEGLREEVIEPSGMAKS